MRFRTIGAQRKDPVLNRDYVGKDASVLAKGIGLTIPEGARLLWAEVPNDHTLVWTEQLMPFLPVTVAPDVDAAIDLAVQVEGGHRHTAAMHSTNVFKSYQIEKGNIDPVFASVAKRSDIVIVEGEYETGAQEQLYIENNGVIAIAAEVAKTEDRGLVRSPRPACRRSTSDPPAAASRHWRSERGRMRR